MMSHSSDPEVHVWRFNHELSNINFINGGPRPPKPWRRRASLAEALAKVSRPNTTDTFYNLFSTIEAYLKSEQVKKTKE